MTNDASAGPPIAAICDAIRRNHRFLISSHARPDGDSVGSQLAMAYALGELGKDVRLVNSDAAPDHYFDFPGVDHIVIADAVDPAWPPFDVEIIMECGDLKRTGVAGLGRAFIVNIDHHLGNTMYGDLNWFDSSASACGELVFELIKELGVPLTFEIATHIYLAILTDTGSFHHSNITPRTFDICRQVTEAGVNPSSMARRIFDSNSYGKLKLIGHLLDSMELHAHGRLAVMYLTQDVLDRADSTLNDTEGIINLPLTAREIQAVVFFKALEPDQVRVSMRSKYDVDVRSVATRYGGGGHTNAAGFTVAGLVKDVRSPILEQLAVEIERATQKREEQLSSTSRK
jgi:phosphoesterase RecJ-like protein